MQYCSVNLCHEICEKKWYLTVYPKQFIAFHIQANANSWWVLWGRLHCQQLIGVISLKLIFKSKIDFVPQHDYEYKVNLMVSSSSDLEEEGMKRGL